MKSFIGFKGILSMTLALSVCLVQSSSAGMNQWTSAGLTGRSVFTLAIDPKTPTTIYAGTDRGVFKTVDDSANWQPTSLVDPVGILAIASQTPAIVYAVGTSTLYKSNDSGSTWVTVASLPSSSLQALAVDPLTPTTLYAGYGVIEYRPVGFGSTGATVVAGGVLKSIDSGATWTDLSLVKTPVYALMFDPANPARLYAYFSTPPLTSTGGGNEGVLRTLDGGTTWQEVPFSDPLSLLAPRRVIDSKNLSTAYEDSFGAYVLRTTDSGRNWLSLSPRPNNNCPENAESDPHPLALTPGGSRLYARVFCRVDGVFSSDEGLFAIETQALMPEVMTTLENPTDGQPVSGIAIIRGWVFPTRSEVRVGEILYSGFASTLHPPCCSERTDVQNAFPQFPARTTLNSGWGITVNWGELPLGEQKISVWIYSTDRRLLARMVRSVTVVKAADYLRFLDQFSLSDADVMIAGDELTVNNVSIVKIAATPTFINTRFRWLTNAQSLGMVQAELVSPQSAAQSAGWSFFASVKDWLWQKMSLGTHAYAGIGMQSFFESPAEDQSASGISIIRGWAFTDSELTPIREIRLLIDGKPAGTIPCCSERDDVTKALNPFPLPFREDIYRSGWGTQLNYGDLTPGAHTLTIQIQASDLTTQTLTRAIQTIRIGGFTFIDQFDLSAAIARIEGEEIVLSGVRVRDKASQQTKVVEVRLRWFAHSQSLGIVASSI